MRAVTTFVCVCHTHVVVASMSHSANMPSMRTPIFCRQKHNKIATARRRVVSVACLGKRWANIARSHPNSRRPHDASGCYINCISSHAASARALLLLLTVTNCIQRVANSRALYAGASESSSWSCAWWLCNRYLNVCALCKSHTHTHIASPIDKMQHMQGKKRAKRHTSRKNASNKFPRLERISRFGSNYIPENVRASVRIASAAGGEWASVCVYTDCNRSVWL